MRQAKLLRIPIVDTLAQIKPNIFNTWRKINTLCSSFTCFLGGVRGFAVKIMTPMGCLTGLGVFLPRGLVGGSYPCGCFKMLKRLSALFFVFHFWINV